MLAALENELKTGGNQLNLANLLTKIDDIRSQRLTPENLTRAKLLHDRVGALIKERQAKAIEQDFTTLKSDVQKLIDAHNYEPALARIAAFPAKDHPTISDRISGLRSDITRARDSYLSSLRSKIQLATSQRNLAKLKELRDQLPEALLGTDAESDITKAIQALEDQRVSEQVAIVQRRAFHSGRELLAHPPHHRSKQRGLAGEVVVQRRLGHGRALGNGVHADRAVALS